MTVVINQPYFLPYIGLMDKVKRADLFIVNDWSPISVCQKTHRRVKVILDPKNRSTRFLTEWVYRHDEGKLFSNIYPDKYFYARIEEIINALTHTYGKTKEFAYLASDLFQQLRNQSANTLGEYNYKIILLLMDKLGIKTPSLLLSSSKFIKKSDLLTKPAGFPNQGTYTALKICQKVRATIYISGQSGPKFLDENAFMENSIEVIHHSLDFKPYPQFNFAKEDFIPGLSVIDLLFNCGKKSSQYIGKGSNFND